MNAMVQYLKDVATLEGQLYTQNWIISSLNGKIQKLGHPIVYNKPELKQAKFDFDALFGSLFLGFGYTFIPGILISWLFADTFWGAVRLYIKIFAVIIVLVNIKWTTNEKKKVERDNITAMQNYEIAVKNDRIRVQHENIQKQFYQEQLLQVKTERDKTRTALNTLYDVGIIHKNYRDMIAVSSFYDYFDTGRCLSFTGPGGAIATYEEDLRFKRLETKVDVIISKLDQIIANQKTLASLMREANNTLYRIEQSNRKLTQSMSRIESNSEVISYNTHCAMQSAMVMEHIAIYNAIKNS